MTSRHRTVRRAPLLRRGLPVAPVLALVVGLCASGARAQDEAPAPLSPRMERQLEHIRRLTRVLHDLRGERASPLSGALPGVPAELDPEARLGKEIALLEQAVLALAAPPVPTEAPRTWSLRSHEPRHEYTVAVDAVAVDPAWIELTNTGEVPVSGARCLRRGDPDLSDGASLLAAALGDAEGDRERAFALFEFLVASRHHAQSATEGVACHDPVRLLNAFGYGLCDDAANVLANLARQAGLQARVWGLTGHVVCEVRYDGGWHLLDVDHEVWYRDADGRAASLAALEVDPSLLSSAVRPPGARGRLPPLADRTRIYASVHDNALATYPPVPSGSMDFVLRPGERIVRRFGHRGYRFTAGRFKGRAVLGNGSWHHVVDLSSGEASPAGGRAVPFRLPYPVLGGLARVEVTEELMARVRAALAEEEREWTAGYPDGVEVPLIEPWPREVPEEMTGLPTITLRMPDDTSGEIDVSDPGSAARTAILRTESASGGWDAGLPHVPTTGNTLLFDLDAAIPNGFGEPVHALDLVVEGDGVLRLEVELVFQLAPASLPALQPGENVFLLTHDTPGGELTVTHAWWQADA